MSQNLQAGQHVEIVNPDTGHSVAAATYIGANAFHPELLDVQAWYGLAVYPATWIRPSQVVKVDVFVAMSITDGNVCVLVVASTFEAAQQAVHTDMEAASEDHLVHPWQPRADDDDEWYAEEPFGDDPNAWQITRSELV